jgi:hypothetical protein
LGFFVVHIKVWILVARLTFGLEARLVGRAARSKLHRSEVYFMLTLLPEVLPDSFPHSGVWLRLRAGYELNE